jgi:hypothetical protein
MSERCIWGFDRPYYVPSRAINFQETDFLSLSIFQRFSTPVIFKSFQTVDYICRGNSIALISDGSQIYGFGNTGADRLHIEPDRIAGHAREFIYDQRLSLI